METKELVEKRCEEFCSFLKCVRQRYLTRGLTTSSLKQLVSKIFRTIAVENKGGIVQKERLKRFSKPGCQFKQFYAFVIVCD